MPLPFFLAGLFGKAASGAVAKGLAAKASAAGTKAMVKHHARHALAQQVVGRLAEKASDAVIDYAVSRNDTKKPDR
jgi:hypothetical protein